MYYAPVICNNDSYGAGEKREHSLPKALLKYRQVDVILYPRFGSHSAEDKTWHLSPAVSSNSSPLGPDIQMTGA